MSHTVRGVVLVAAVFIAELGPLDASGSSPGLGPSPGSSNGGTSGSGTVLALATRLASSVGYGSAPTAGPVTPPARGSGSRLQVAAASSPAAGIGDTIVLNGMDQGEQIAATVVRVRDPGQPASDVDQPQSGQRLVGVQVRLVNTGTTTYSDSPDNGAILVDKSGQSFPADVSSITAGASFPGTVNISPGGTRLGYIVFTVPQSSAIDTFQFTLDSGFAGQTGEWSVAGAAKTSHTDPAEVVTGYYAAINNRDFRTAWDLGGKNFGQSYNEFVAGFDQTTHDTLTIVATSGNRVRVSLDAEQTDGSHRHFGGTYTVSGNEITGANIRPD
jgi:hypothetical protein